MRLTLIIIILFISFPNHSFSQAKHKKKESSIIKDTLDHKLDVSRYLIDANGFIPLIQVVTEPALGGFGLMLTPIFIHPNKYQEKGKYIPPNITAGFAMYTANKTWMVGAIRMASLPKYGLKYRGGLAHGQINIDFYRQFPSIGDQKFSFTFKSTPVFFSVMKEVKKGSNLFIGLEYLYVSSKITPKFDFIELPDFIDIKDINSKISSIGVGLDFDTRDNIFSPNTGMQIGSNYRVNADWTGSDYEYQNFNASLFKYFQTNENWVSGFRFDTKFQFGNAPFYANPGIDLRGVPSARYQGSEVYVIETEQRYDFSLRWSGVFFTGLAKASSENISFSKAELIYNYGVGFRYLLARIFKLRVGIDVAKSNHDWGYYITFGSAWNNRN